MDIDQYKLQQILALVPECWHKEFLAFIETGEGSPAFNAMLDDNEQCQQAVQMAFDEVMRPFTDHDD